MIKIANAPCSWGVLEFDLDKKSESPGYGQVLDEIKATGYMGTELGDWGFMPTDPGKLQAVLQSRDLQLLGAFVPVALADPGALASGIEVAIKTARLMEQAGYPGAFIVLADNNGTQAERTQNAGRIRSDQGLSPKQWEVFAKAADKLAKEVHDATGLRTVFHHHCAGFVETPTEIATLMELTDPKLVGLCFDTGHYAFGGGDPLKGLLDHRDRIWHVHFKDFDPNAAKKSRDANGDYFDAIQRGVFCPLGMGVVDFKIIVEALERTGYMDWIVVEQDVLPGMGAPKISAKANRKFIQNLGW